MKLDFLLCGSATDSFFSQIAFFRLCLDKLGGAYRDARLVTVFGDHHARNIPKKWKRYFENIEIEWDNSPAEIDPLFYRRHYRRFELVRPDADLAILCDADVAILTPFDELIKKLGSKPAISGVIAHYHFAHGDKLTGNPEMDWLLVSKTIIGKDIELPYRYSLCAGNDGGKCPFYINYGVFIGTPDLLKEFHSRAIQLRSRVYEMTKSWFTEQITVPLVCKELNLPTACLPMKYNYPNDPIADSMYPEDMRDIKFLHYLRTDKFDRHQIFAGVKCFSSFLNMTLEGSNEIFRRSVYEATGGTYPFLDTGEGEGAGLSTLRRLSGRFRHIFRYRR